ncbi:hypothetical protein EE36_06678 [Sulfitobacter sp. EE-36]|nr:hypothetical protein EE36_06678 [Sulfitobacter sp. EE-36]
MHSFARHGRFIDQTLGVKKPRQWQGFAISSGGKT